MVAEKQLHLLYPTITIMIGSIIPYMNITNRSEATKNIEEVEEAKIDIKRLEDQSNPPLRSSSIEL